MRLASELLGHVPGCEAGRTPHSMQPLAGGRGANSVWRVRTTAGDFVLRLRHEPVDRPGSISGFELASHRLAAASGIAPRLVNAAPDGRWLVMDFVDASMWSEAQLLSDAGLDALGAVLGRLHSLPCTALPPVDVIAMSQGYRDLILVRYPQRASIVAAELADIEQAARELDRISDRAVLNHGDLTAANLLGTAPLLVDWEYAQRADPTWDVACLLEYYPALEPRLDRLMAACGLDSAQDRQILSLQRRVFEGLNRLWQHAEA